MAKDTTNKRWHSNYNLLLKRAAPKLCMMWTDCKPAAKCHSISERRILQRIAENGQVMAVTPSDVAGHSTLKRQGIGQVSTFSGFCSKHDQELFAPIDNFDYIPENSQQEFLFAYRTLARYHYYKLTWRYSQEAWLATYQNARTSDEKLYSTGLKRQLTEDEIDRLIAMHERNTKDAISKSEAIRDFMRSISRGITHKDYSIATTRIVHFPDEYPVAQSGSLIVGSLNRGRQPHAITVNVIPQGGQTYALLSCMGNHGTTCIDDHLERFRSREEIDYRAALTHIMCMAGDPIAIKPSYWEALPSDLKSSFIERLNVWQHGGVDPIQPDGSFNILRK